MKLNQIALLILVGSAGLASAQTISDPAHIEVYFIVGNPSACRGLPALPALDVVFGRALHSVSAVPCGSHWRVATAIAFDRY